MGAMNSDGQTDGAAGDTGSGENDSAVWALRRWEDTGGVWRVVSRSDGWVEVSFLTCNAGEEMGRLTSADREVLEFIGARSGSDEPTP